MANFLRSLSRWHNSYFKTKAPYGFESYLFFFLSSSKTCLLLAFTILLRRFIPRLTLCFETFKTRISLSNAIHTSCVNLRFRFFVRFSTPLVSSTDFTSVKNACLFKKRVKLLSPRSRVCYFLCVNFTKDNLS